MEFFLTRSYNAHLDSLMKEFNIFLKSPIYFILLTKIIKNNLLREFLTYINVREKSCSFIWWSWYRKKRGKQQASGGQYSLSWSRLFARTTGEQVCHLKLWTNSVSHMWRPCPRPNTVDCLYTRIKGSCQ